MESTTQNKIRRFKVKNTGIYYKSWHQPGTKKRVTIFEVVTL